MPANYRIKIYDQDDTPLGELVNWFDVSFNKKLNDYGQCSVSFSSDDELVIPFLALRRYVIKIYRDDTLVWAGEQIARRGSLQANSENMVTLTGAEFLEKLSQRYTGAYRRFDNVDAGTIAWTLIDESQSLTNGDYGFTQGTIQTTKNRDRTYANKNILEAIKELSQVIDGFDFELTSDKEFKIYTQKGIDRTATTVFEYGTNIESMNIEEDFSKIVNSSIVLGEDNRVERTTTTSASIYKLRQTVVNADNTTEDTTLNDKGDSVNRKYKAPLLAVSFTQLEGTNPQFGSIALGDIVKIRVDRGIYRINNNFRVYGFNVKVTRDKREQIEYIVGLI